jgi:hypothetical protein
MRDMMMKGKDSITQHDIFKLVEVKYVHGIEHMPFSESVKLHMLEEQGDARNFPKFLL